MIKLFTPEHFRDYIESIQNGSSIKEIYNSSNEGNSIHGSSELSDLIINGYDELIDGVSSDELSDNPISQNGSDELIDSNDGSSEIVDDPTGPPVINHDNYRPSFNGNGDIILRPSACSVEAEINGTWKLSLTHEYDSEGRYTYITEGAVIAVNVRLTREQRDEEQYFRIFGVKENLTGVEVTAYPVIYEANYETPIECIELQEVTPNEFKSSVLGIVTNKYDIQFEEDLGYETESLYLENTNLQEVINGSQEGTFTSLYETEVVYDNYVYRIKKQVGDPDTYKDYKINYAVNITSINVSEETDEMVTRVYPMSNEGITAGAGYHVDSTNIENFPIAYAKSIKYSDVKLVDEKAEDDDTPETATQVATREAKAAIAAKVNELSLRYLQNARRGEYETDREFSNKKIHNPHNPHLEYDYATLRKSLPYGYLFYSYTDAIGILCQRVLDDVTSVVEIKEERDLFEEAIKEGFKWCESTDIAGYDWHLHVDYDDPDYRILESFHWLKDDIGWWYGDGQGHWLTDCWVEDARDKHYWVDDHGYWQEAFDDRTPWEWYQDEHGWWYGSKNEDGTTKNFAVNQYIHETKTDNWYWFDDNGYFIDGDVKRWRYGTEDGKDIVTMQYWTVGSETWWFDENGYIAETLSYAPKFEWREDAVGEYYGDGSGHWLANCWVEDSDSKHRWIDQDGYYYGDDDESTNKYDGQQWTWHGNWNDGWWYGCNYEDDDDDDDDDNTSTSSGSDTNTSANTSLFSGSLLPEFEGIDQLFSQKRDTTGMDTTTKQDLLSQGYFYLSNNRYLVKLKKKFTNVSTSSFLTEGLIDNLEDMGYKYDEDEDTLEISDSSTSPSGEDLDPEDKTGLKNYVHGQFMQVTDANKWYWFNEEGYYIDCWLATDSWEWHNDSKGWWYGDGAGTYPRGQWMKIGGKWYFFDENGYADDTTDDFEDPKTGSYESATYDNNREGIKASSSNNTSNEETVYDSEREGVKAWIQDGFVDELYLVIVEQHNKLHALLKEELTNAAKKDLKELDHPKYTITVDFNTLATSDEYDQFGYLKELYLGDTVTILFPIGGISSIDRITTIKYDCIKDDIASITIGNPTKTFIKKMANLTPKGTIRKWQPTYGLEDGYGGYLLTGFSGTNLTVE